MTRPVSSPADAAEEEEKGIIVKDPSKQNPTPSSISETEGSSHATQRNAGSSSALEPESQVSTILLGLSGPSSSGKTTLARLLRTIFNISTSPTPSPPQEPYTLSLFVLHQDDFYLTDTQVPVITVSSDEFGTRDLLDWDCVESLDLPLLEETLRHVKAHGWLPEGSVSKEDQNSVGETGVTEAEVQAMKEKVREWFEKVVGERDEVETRRRRRRKEIRIFILDGFLLYPLHPSSPSSSPPLTHLYTLSHSLLSPRLFLPSTREQTLSRRLRRSGYVTLEGFWTDPPGYVQDVVWPNYVRDHGWMYKDGGVDGNGELSGEGHVFDEERLKQEGIQVCPGGGSWDMERVLGWAVERVKEAVVEKIREDR